MTRTYWKCPECGWRVQRYAQGRPLHPFLDPPITHAFHDAGYTDGAYFDLVDLRELAVAEGMVEKHEAVHL